MNPIPPINQVFSLVIQDEKQREIGIIANPCRSEVAYAVQSEQ